MPALAAGLPGAAQHHRADAVFAIDSKPVAIELFDSPQTFRCFMRKVIGSFAIDGLSSIRPIDTKPKLATIELFLHKIGQAGVGRFKAVGAGYDLRLSGKNVVGGALEVGDQLLHLTAFHLQS